MIPIQHKKEGTHRHIRVCPLFWADSGEIKKQK